ncbi:MAG TPA: DUF5317 family protein [Chloroflexota bacterium]|nr:DUF5317 family protein [Chloroflexota bacterium]
MIFALAVIASLVVAFLRGRSMDDVLGKPFEVWPLAVVGVALHLVVSLSALASALADHPAGSVLPLGALLYLASYAFLIVFLVANRHHPGFVVLLLGLLLNVFEIASNAGQMPTDPQQLALAGMLDVERQAAALGRWSPHSVADGSTLLAWLDDRIIVLLPFHHGALLSIGDGLICIGCFLFCNDPFRRPSLVATRQPVGVGQ